MKLLLLGALGSGKGTVGELLSNSLNIPSISAGQMLRDIPPTHPRYEEIQGYLNKGELAPHVFTAELLKERVSQPDCQRGFIFDGWGRRKLDLEAFDPEFDKVIYLVVSPETSIERLSNRRTCKICGKVYNIKTVPPRVEGVCDYCGGELYQREDDVPEAILRRLEIFQNETSEVIEMYKEQGKLVEVNAEPMPETVLQAVLLALDVNDPVEIA